MTVLVCGASGFIGQHVVKALRQAGHRVVQGVSPRQAAGADRWVVDFSADADPAVWLPRLAGIDAVVNTVGILRGSAHRPMQQVHAAAPAALFAACEQAGVRHVVQISALGIAHSDSPYAVSKRTAEGELLRRVRAGTLHGTVLRPSVVYGPGGASAGLFDGLARLPWLPLPAAVANCRVQPIHVDDLAAAVCRVLAAEVAGDPIVPCVGPRALSLAQFIAELRQQCGRRQALTFTVPNWLTRCSVALADAVPVTPWGSQALDLLATDNTADATPLQRLLGRPARDPGTFSC
jgi:uncharacterized protein YbjT (DUF2867 family)